MNDSIDMNVNIEDIFVRNVPGTRDILLQKTIAIAGCGGLGSNAAVALVRAGIGQLIIADFDTVEISNLNRQYYFLSDVGKKKTEALTTHLLAINPELKIIPISIELTRENVPQLLGEADLLIEAFDRADRKCWLIESWSKHFPKKTVVCASGISGYGNTSSLVVKKAGNIVICGDQETDMNMGLSAPRVAIAANMEANIAIEILINQSKKGF